MKPAASLETLIRSLSGDRWRQEHRFSEDIRLVSEILLSPHTNYDDRCLAIKGWLMAKQPCLFGKMAAKDGKIFYSLIDDAIIQKGDRFIIDKINHDKRNWKRWSAEGNCFHSFMLIVASRYIYDAAPNRALYQVAKWFEDVITLERQEDPEGNSISTEWLSKTAANESAI